MIRKQHILIFVLLFFLNIILISVNAQETIRNIEIDGDSNPEFVIHWRYSDFLDNTRADDVVEFVENSIKEAWQKFIVEWGFNEPLDGTIDLYITDVGRPWGPYDSYTFLGSGVWQILS